MTYPMPLAELARHVAERGDQPFLHQPINRQLKIWTWAEVDDNARRIAQGLISLGLEPGDRVAIFAKNSAEWFIADWAIMMAGMISVPIYATANEDTIRHIIEDSGSKAVFVGKLDEVAAGEAAFDGGLARIGFPYPTLTHDHRWDDWLAQHAPLKEVADLGLNDVMTLVYTSGSTGKPKGVVLKYRQYAAASATNRVIGQITEYDRTVSYLPLAHVTERAVVQGTALYTGGPVYFVESLDTFVDDLKVAQPTTFLSVPRLWTRFQAGIHEKIPPKTLQFLLRIPLVGQRVARKIRAGLGLDSVHTFGSGSALLAPSLLQWYHRLGIDICEGWGMTETTGLSACNMPFRADRMGTIGVPLDCVDMKIADDGELLIRGDAVFETYYNNPEVTADAFQGGWFRTGDKAEKRSDGAFRIVGRLKEAFKTAKGKYVAPGPLESRLAANADIEQVCVIGAGRTQPVAVVVLAEHRAESDRKAMRASLRETLETLNASLESHEKLEGILVAAEPWTIESGQLTPTMKLRRSSLEDCYDERLGQLSAGEVRWEDESRA
ncbi:AMP-dependent synthetase [Saccharospirillum sp. MSK14-1]|uniref:AMP-binding protein n=1 Tax=Saccharospirillum sp. MSK14-1 TaxID=1897632 RepID=UPI000D3897A4|nr:AMP-binding protein [Saccharospirillum sp. MSK14-1]PTY36496.1 AMP-dependent synthetase [Saccharospirillum sp. MSK14-1]